MYMTKSDIIAFLQQHPYVKITHNLFTKNEYIYSREDGCVYDENDRLFEDWHSVFYCGLRLRTADEWNRGWTLLAKPQYTPSSTLQI